MNLIKIPFIGFNGTIHEDQLEEFSIDKAEKEGIRLEDVRDTMKEYCKQYVLEYNKYLPQGISIEYSHFTSPKEYTYHNTDMIMGTISEASIQLLYKEGLPKLTTYVRKNFSPRKGYIPYYSDNLSHWGSVDIWSSVQLGCLLEVLVGDYIERTSNAHPTLE